jgi:ferric-dicitrate binding protein FerR (iron transport regulator)
VTILGTRFRLDASGSDLELLVVEGLVILEANGAETTVAALELARVTGAMSLPRVQTLPLADLHSAEFMPEWLDNFVAFQETALQDVALELEREFGVRVEISDTALESRTFTGWFSGWAMDEVMDVICVATNADCSTTAGGSLIMQAKRTSR